MGGWNPLKSIGGFIEDAWDTVSGAVEDAWDWNYDLMSDTWDFLTDWIQLIPEMPDSATYNDSDRIYNTIKEGVFAARCYGKCKVGGNKLRFNAADATDLRIIVAHCRGPIKGPVSFQINDIDWDELTGAHTKTEYIGDRTQVVDARFTEKASAYRGMAYTAFTFVKNDKQVGYNPTITTIMEGLLCSKMPVSYVNATYTWVLQTGYGGTDEYYCTVGGVGFPINGGTNSKLYIDGVEATRGAVYSLNPGEWGLDVNKLLLVRLSDGADPGTKADDFITFESSEYSRNIAVILYDWYRNVEGYSIDSLDIDYFNSLEELCDEVPTGGTLPRYRFDYSFDSNVTINDAKKLIWQSFNGMAIMSQGKIKPIWDSAQMGDGSGSLTAKTVSYAFTMDNIVKESFTWAEIESPNIVRIYFKDSENNYKTSSVEEKDISDIEENGEILYEETCNFITDQEIAARRARFKFNKSRYPDYTCTFSALSEAGKLEIYDLVSVTHTLPGWTTKQFIVTGKTEDEIGRPKITLEAYYSGIYDDATLGQQENFSSNLPNPYLASAAATAISAIMKAIGVSLDFNAVGVTFTPPDNDPFYSYSEVYASTDDSTYYYVGQSGTGEFVFNGLGSVYELDDTVYIKLRSISETGVPGVLSSSADATVEVASTMKLSGFYAGTYDLWGGNASIAHASTTIVLGNLDGTPKIALGPTADSISVAGTAAGFIADGTGKVYFGNGSNRFVKFDGTNLSWEGAYTSLTAAGLFTATSASISGAITATSGVIGGFTVNSSEGLYAGTGVTRVQMKAGAGFWAGATAIGDAPTSITNAGVFKATSATVTGAINATSGKFGTSTNHWSVSSTGLTAIASGSDVKISYGKTDFGDTTLGFILGYDHSASVPKFEMGNATDKIAFTGSSWEITKGTLIENIIQMYTSVASLATTATVGDGTANSSGMKITYEGLFGCGPNQTATASAENANVRILSDGSAFFNGNVTITGGSGIAELSDAGDLATQSRTDLDYTDGADVTIDNLSGSGVNLFLPAYVNPSVTPDFYVNNGSLTAEYYVGDVGQPSRLPTVFRFINPTGSGFTNGYVFFSASNYTTNIPVIDGQDYILSFWAMSDISTAGDYQNEVYVRFNNSPTWTYRGVALGVQDAGVWVKYSCVVEAVADSTHCAFRVDNDVQGSILYIDQIMFEPMIGNSTVASPYTPPIPADGRDFTFGADITSTVIEGGLVTTGTLQVVNGGTGNTAGITGEDSGDTAVRFYAGDTFANRATAPFNVTQAGIMSCTGANITGAVTVGGTITSDNWDTAAGMQINLTDGEITVRETDGLVIDSVGGLSVTSGGGIAIAGGGDIILTGSDSNPGSIQFNSTARSVKFGIEATNDVLSILPDAKGKVAFNIGNTQSWSSITDPNFKSIDLAAAPDGSTYTDSHIRLTYNDLTIGKNVNTVYINGDGTEIVTMWMGTTFPFLNFAKVELSTTSFGFTELSTGTSEQEIVEFKRNSYLNYEINLKAPVGISSSLDVSGETTISHSNDSLTSPDDGIILENTDTGATSYCSPSIRFLNSGSSTDDYQNRIWGYGGAQKFQSTTDGGSNWSDALDLSSGTAKIYGSAVVESGKLILKEITAPATYTNYGQVYTKSDNKLYFKDGGGTEHEIAFV